MGADSSKMPAVAAAEKMFTSNERSRITEHLEEMMVSPQAFGFNHTPWEKFVADKLCKELRDNLFGHMLKVENEAGIEAPRLVAPGGYFIALSQFLKGSLTEKISLLIGLCGNESEVCKQRIMKMLNLLLNDYCKYVSSTEAYTTWKLRPCDENDVNRLTECITSDLPEKDEIPLDTLERWLPNSVLLLQVLDNMMHYVFPINDEEEDAVRVPIFPHCEHADWQKHGTFLDIPSILFLNQHIPVDHQSPWRFCFSTEAHGESFSRLVKHIVEQGPSIILLRDPQGRVFGGFASHSWQLGPHFFGNSRCFLFSMLPDMAAYLPTGLNENFMYFNQGQETMPNGIPIKLNSNLLPAYQDRKRDVTSNFIMTRINAFRNNCYKNVVRCLKCWTYSFGHWQGFGGQLNYFGLWLDSEFGEGQSKAEPKCTTYNSPQLSENPNFAIHALEVWAVGVDPKLVILEDEEGHEKNSSILDKDPGAKAMLSLVGKGPLSEGLRETDPMASLPEEHKTFMS